MTNNEAWNFAIGLVQLDGVKPSEDFKVLVAREQSGEINNDDIRKLLVKKYGRL